MKPIIRSFFSSAFRFFHLPFVFSRILHIHVRKIIRIYSTVHFPENKSGKTHPVTGLWFIMLEKLKISLEKSPMVKRGEYNYFIHQISDGIPAIEPEILEEIAAFIAERADLNVTKILTIEAMGLPIATALSLRTGIPVNLLRKREYKLPGEVRLSQETGYSKGTIYINGLTENDRVLIVDDVISTGGTLLPLIKTLRNMGVSVSGAFCVIGRGRGKETVEKETGVPVTVLVDIEVDENGVKVVGGTA